MHASNNLVSVIFLTGKKCGKRCFFLSSFERFKNGKKIIREGGGGATNSEVGRETTLFFSFQDLFYRKVKKKKNVQSQKLKEKSLSAEISQFFHLKRKTLSRKKILFSTLVFIEREINKIFCLFHIYFVFFFN